MTAQQQLAELLAVKANPTEATNGQLWAIQAAVFLRDHGPAIAELIEEAQYATSSLSGQDYRRLTAALAALTEPK